MSNEIKGVSFRLGEEDIQKFREFAEEQGLNQAEMFQAMINNFEIARAKNSFSDRAKEIETFQTTVNTLIGMFVNSLAINQTSEDRIRETLSTELNTKDKTITSLQEKEKELRKQLEKAEGRSEEYFGKYYQISKLVETLKSESEKKDSIMASLQEQTTTLNKIITEYKPYKEEVDRLTVENSELAKAINALQNENNTLLSKIENLNNMKDFYQNQVEDMKNEAKETAKRVIDRDQEYKEMFNTLTKQHKEELEKQKQELITSLKEDFASKIEIEKSKYQLELESMKKRENNSTPQVE